MAQSVPNNIRIRSPTINNIIRNDVYDPEYITKAEQEYIKKHTPKPRTLRIDLKCGDVVAILEGGYMGKKAVFLQRLEGCMVLVSGVPSLNGMSAVKIDERYLLKLDVSVTMEAVPKVDFSSVIESKLGEAERMEESSDSPLSEAILDAVKQVKFLRAYLAEPFTVDLSADFYTQKY